MADNIVIRPVGEDEREAWNPLWAGYLAFYKIGADAGVSDLAWDRFHDPDEPMFALGGYVDGELMGIAHYLFHRSTWAPHRYCYLEDLFVAERRAGSRAGTGADRGGLREGPGGECEPGLLADAIEQHAGADSLRQGRRQSRLHPVP